MLIDVRAPSAYKTHGVGTVNIPRGPLELNPAPEEDGLPEKSNTNEKT